MSIPALPFQINISWEELYKAHQHHSIGESSFILESKEQRFRIRFYRWNRKKKILSSSILLNRNNKICAHDMTIHIKSTLLTSGSRIQASIDHPSGISPIWRVMELMKCKEWRLYSGILAFMITGLKSSVLFIFPAVPKTKLSGYLI